jgi:hypothetical protein
MGLLGWATSARRHYRRRGYQVFRGALPVDLINALAISIRRQAQPYEGPLLRQDGRVTPHEFFPGTSLVCNSLANAHLPLCKDMGQLEENLTAVITSSALASRLRMLDGASHYNIHQTLIFFAAQSTELHIDSWALDTAPRGFAHTVWVPLQDMGPRSGLPGIIPWPVGRAISEAELGLPEVGSVAERYDRYHHALSTKLIADGPDIVTAAVRAGDFIVWSSLTPHLTLPASYFPSERLSLQILLRPINLRWGSFLDQPSDHPTNRHLRVNDHFSYFVNERISQEFGIAGIGGPATGEESVVRDHDRHRQIR